MTKKNLENFKIADTQKLEVRSTSKKAAAKAQAEQSASVGFARIEKLIESEQPEVVNARLSALHSNLQGYFEGAKSAKDKASAQKAMAAVERTSDLMDYLFQTKAKMAQELATSAPTKGKK